MLEKENQVLERLGEQFSCLAGKGTVPGERRIFLDVPEDILMDVLGFACSELHFDQLCTITGLDDGDCFQVIYHIADDNGIVLNLKRNVSKENPAVPTVLSLYNGALYYEKEIEDLLGIKVEGLPAGRHYPLPDNWPEGQYPLRKDWNPDSLSGIR